MDDEDVKRLTRRYENALNDQNQRIDRLVERGASERGGETGLELLRKAYDSPEHRDPVATGKRIRRQANKRSKGR